MSKTLCSHLSSIDRHSLRAGRLCDLISPDPKALKRIRPERRGDRNVGGVASAGDQKPPNAWRIVAWIKHMPLPSEIGLEPRSKIARWIGLGSADVAEVASAIARRNVKGSAKCDGQVRIVTADA